MEEKLAIQVDGRADYLVSMMLQQAQLENKIYEKAFNLGLGDLTSVDKCQFIKDCVHWVTEELHEMTRELPFMKHWKNYNPTKEEYDEMVIKAKKEYIDAFHFMLNIAVLFDMDAPELYELYEGKNRINHERQDNNY